MAGLVNSHHSTVRLKINLRHLCANFQTIVATAKPSTVAAVVKANAYGLGLLPVARALAAAGCRDFFVASMSEALLLREHVAEAAIFVLEGAGDDPEEALAHRLTPVLNSVDEWRVWRDRAPTLPWCVQVDTGIGRAGIDEAQWFAQPSFVQQIAQHPHVWLLSQWACADDPAHPMNDAQWHSFQRFHQSVPNARTSLANSAGLNLAPARWGSMVRPGLALYGGQPSAVAQDWIRPVVSVEARVLQVKTFARAHPIGYGATDRVAAGTTVATLGLGYADGFPRERIERGHVLFNGHRYPLVGRVSMDLMTVVINRDDQPVPEVGQWMTVLGESNGESISLEQIAAWSNRSSHSILTGWSALVERVYD